MLAGAMLLIASWLTGPLPSSLSEVTTILRSFTPVAAAMLVVTCIGWNPMQRLLSWGPFQFVKKISFSLYVCHVPILIFSMYLFAGLPLIVAQIFGVSIAVVVASAFWWILESRSHDISKRVGLWVSARWADMHSERPDLERVEAGAPDTGPLDLARQLDPQKPLRSEGVKSSR